MRAANISFPRARAPRGQPICTRLCAAECKARDISRSATHNGHRAWRATGDDALAKRIHKDQGTKSTLAKHYDRSRRLKAMLVPLQRWADALEAMASETAT